MAKQLTDDELNLRRKGAPPPDRGNRAHAGGGGDPADGAGQRTQAYRARTSICAFRLPIRSASLFPAWRFPRWRGFAVAGFRSRSRRLLRVPAIRRSRNPPQPANHRSPQATPKAKEQGKEPAANKTTGIQDRTIRSIRMGRPNQPVEGFVAQVGAYSIPMPQNREADKLKKWGFKALYRKSLGDKVRVRVGPVCGARKGRKKARNCWKNTGCIR